MPSIKKAFDKPWKINVLLLLCSFSIYAFYFYPIFLSINSTLSSITLDSLKNYYTFVYHIKNDPEALAFTGMNYPFGEHVVYTDCQPVLTFLLRLLPFTHPYLIGIMHSLMFLSFITTPLILNKLFIRMTLDKFTSFFVSLALALLAPQFLKINAGHFALAYGFVFPLSILLTLDLLKTNGFKQFILLLLFNTLLFLLHPYLGFCCSILSLISVGLFYYSKINKATFLKENLFILGTGIFPILFFKIFMLLTDTHVNRTKEPFGVEMMLENIDSIVSPVFGPFKSFMEIFFSNRTQHYEGHSYLGFASIVLTLVLLILAPFLLKKIKLDKSLLSIFIASLFILFISFGWHLSVLNFLNIQSASLNQFRAVCRFAWVFYYTLPVFVLVTLYHTLKDRMSEKKFTSTLIAASLLFFCCNLLETHYFFQLDSSSFWKYRNVFNEDQLNQEEQNILAKINAVKPQALIPLPVFHGGSEMYDRLGSSNSMLPAMIYSYHSNTPILSVMLSRTSITETEDLLELLNSYKKEKKIVNQLKNTDFFIIKTQDALLPDETRLLGMVSFFTQHDSLSFGYISVKDLLSQKKDSITRVLNNNARQAADSNNIILIPFENKKPYIPANIIDYENIFTLDSNQLKSGKYIVSMHYHYSEKIFRAISSNLIITKTDHKTHEWQYNIPIRYLSGFYNGFAVFEYPIELSSKNKYEFILKGFFDETYHISHFLLRPEHTTVFSVNNRQDTLINNFQQ